MSLTKVTYSMIDGVETVTTPNTTPVSYISRTTNYSGGTPGFVCSALQTRTTTNADNANFEWTSLSILDNYANAGENVAVYGQSNKYSQLGPTWAGVFEAKDHMPSSASASGGLVGIEVDVFANGTDVSNNRIGIDIVAGRTNSLDTTCRITWGIRLNAQENNPANATYAGGILLNANMVTGIQIANTMTRGIYFTGTVSVGIDFSQATASAAVIRVGADQIIDLDNFGVMKIKAPAATGNMLRFFNTATEIFGFHINSGSPYMQILGTQVVGARIGGFATMTGAGNAATVYDTATINLQQLAQRVKSIQDALSTHGLIGA